MLIPSIDLKDDRIVQLIQGERLALATDDVDGWIQAFAHFPTVQLIDLDAAMRTGTNELLARRIMARLPCRLGGGIRSVDRARTWLDAGAQALIVGSALFAADGQPDLAFAGVLADAVGRERLIAAIDSRGGRVVVQGWRAAASVTAPDAAVALEPYCAEFLYTHVDTEGLMQGVDLEAVRAVRAATSRRVSAAGGISSQAEIDALDAMGVDAVVGMAIYTGKLGIGPSAD